MARDVGGKYQDFELRKADGTLVADAEPVFNKSMLDLAKWVADYYMASLGEVLKATMPYSTTDLSPSA